MHLYCTLFFIQYETLFNLFQLSDVAMLRIFPDVYVYGHANPYRGNNAIGWLAECMLANYFIIEIETDDILRFHFKAQ